MRYVDEFRIPEAVRHLAHEARRSAQGRITFMEVCGTHTMSISRFGLRPLLAPEIELISGPGCPVCVTTDEEIDTAIAVSKLPDVLLTTFGDMMKVPGTEGSLADAAAEGAKVTVVYSPLEALSIAEKEPGKRVVFLGIGFETTAPAVAATVMQARNKGIENFFLLSMHKLVPPALRALAEQDDFRVQGFMLPGHVSTIIGRDSYAFLASEFGIPCVVAGFEAADIAQAVCRLAEMQEEVPSVETEYSRAVRPEGNTKAQRIMGEVFEINDARWRGLGLIPESGLVLREGFSDIDAGSWRIELPRAKRDTGCRCGDILLGAIRPDDCPLFSKRCTPQNPVGPCMVSSEGTCASYYLYREEG